MLTLKTTFKYQSNFRLLGHIKWRTLIKGFCVWLTSRLLRTTVCMHPTKLAFVFILDEYISVEGAPPRYMFNGNDSWVKAPGESISCAGSLSTSNEARRPVLETLTSTHSPRVTAFSLLQFKIKCKTVLNLYARIMSLKSAF